MSSGDTGLEDWCEECFQRHFFSIAWCIASGWIPNTNKHIFLANFGIVIFMDNYSPNKKNGKTNKIVLSCDFIV